MSQIAAGPAGDMFLGRLLEVVRESGPDGRVPSERALAERLEVSRPTVRDRLSLLEGIGALERRVGSGTYLRALRAGDIAGIIQLGVLVGTLDAGVEVLRPVVTALEVQAAAMAARNQRILKGRLESAARPSPGSPDDLRRADQRFRKVLVNASGDPAIPLFHEALTRVVDVPGAERSRRTAVLARNPDRLSAGHRRILAALADGDTTRAAEAMRDHEDWLAGAQKAQSSSSVFTALPIT